MSDELYTIPLQTIDGETTTLAPFKGKILLIVNVASRCGFTKQYAELEALYQQYKEKGLVILGFPCNQFLKQEPGDEQSIKRFAESCYHVSFPMFAKSEVKGANQSPLYAYLAQHIEKKPWIFIPWNFTKILIDQSGSVRKRYPPTTSMTQIRQAVDELLEIAA